MIDKIIVMIYNTKKIIIMIKRYYEKLLKSQKLQTFYSILYCFWACGGCMRAAEGIAGKKDRKRCGAIQKMPARNLICATNKRGAGKSWNGCSVLQKIRARA